MTELMSGWRKVPDTLPVRPLPITWLNMVYPIMPLSRKSSSTSPNIESRATIYSIFMCEPCLLLIHLFLNLRKGYTKHHKRSTHDPHVCRKVFDPPSSFPASCCLVPLQICTRLLLRHSSPISSLSWRRSCPCPIATFEDCNYNYASGMQRFGERGFLTGFGRG